MAHNAYSDGKLYYSLDNYFKNRYGSKVFKVSLNGGFTCPNIDGTKGTGGCTYCSSSGSGDFAGNPSQSLEAQFENIVEMMHRKWKNVSLYMPYFQAHTNTYAPVERLKSVFEPFIGKEEVVGLDIATRSDALEEDVLEYLSDINSRTDLIVELGLQSVFDETGKRINRCMSYEEYLNGYTALKSRGIKVCVHLIDGLPGESADMMLESARQTAALSPDFVKLHLLHVIKGTKLASEYERGEFKTLSMDEYIDIIVKQLELFSPETVIARLTGDGKRSELIAPEWSLRKFEVLNAIDRELKKRNTFQGRLFGR
ncbi:MAG: TIGR01212 family radical SAM protein [Clostridia bacterium]|nr:TIGR01212 family radical SAM protein [Clostridia bacterium]